MLSGIVGLREKIMKVNFVMRVLNEDLKLKERSQGMEKVEEMEWGRMNFTHEMGSVSLEYGLIVDTLAWSIWNIDTKAENDKFGVWQSEKIQIGSKMHLCLCKNYWFMFVHSFILSILYIFL